MGIKFKSLIIILISALLLIFGEFAISELFFINHITSQENLSVKTECDRVRLLLDDYSASIKTVTVDWSPWDETLHFVRTLDEDYIKSNLSPNALNNLKVNVVAFFDKNKNMIYTLGYDPEAERIEPISDGLRSALESYKSTICRHGNVKDINSGVINVNGSAMLIASGPITDSEFKAPVSGTLLIGRYIDDTILSNIKKITNANVEILLKANVSDPIDRKMIDNPAVSVAIVDKNTVQGYSYIKDINGKPLFLLKIGMERAIYQHGKTSMIFFITISLVMILIVTLVMIILLQINILSPVIALSNSIRSLDLDTLVFPKLPFKGKDEISVLSREINKMLMKIERNNKKNFKREKQLALALEGAKLGFWDLEVDKKTVYLNKKSKQIIGHPQAEDYFDSNFLQEIIHSDDLALVVDKYNKGKTENTGIDNLEFRVLTESGTYKWISVRGSSVEYAKGNIPKRMTGIMVDIDDQKRNAEELDCLRYYDKLTGLFNRGYFEYLLKKRIEQELYPFSIVIGDINGLKVANDTFGHYIGDDMIKAVADTMKSVCRSVDVLSRWGGDEFAIILDNSDDALAEEICQSIKQRCIEKKVGPIALNISMGYSTIRDKDGNIKNVIKEAEERMYRNKLFEAKSARNSIISSLKKTLSEKSHETEEHTGRMHEKCLKIGKKMNMSNAKIDELVLLAMLHDIGKIAIPEYILDKPGKLNPEEWEIMKTHTEVGYRIAAATSELSHIAYAILTHHERYDGSGYPRGIKSTEIPMISRIISIIDAFDVMTNDRPYSKAKTAEDAIEELRRCSGTQFDPDLVELCIEVFKED